MKYYEGHEEEYKKRLAKSQVDWDGGKYDEFGMRGLIERFIKESDFNPAQSKTLDCMFCLADS